MDGWLFIVGKQRGQGKDEMSGIGRWGGIYDAIDESFVEAAKSLMAV